MISALITGTGVFSTRLANGGVDLPIVQSSLNYVLLCGFLLRALPRARRRGSLAVPWWRYALWALCDVEGNYLVVSAYQLTSITSVSLLDCFAIPCAMVFSRLLLGSRHALVHVVACLVCLAGLALTVLSDAVGRGGAGAAPRGPAWLGDAMVITGATLYGLSNVLQEGLLKGGTSRPEALGMLGLFGTAVCAVQAAALEGDALLQTTWHAGRVLDLVGFQLCLFGMYVLTSIFLGMADATVFNMSLLTSDFYSVAFAWLVQGQRPTWLYAAAFATTMSGLVLYYSKPVGLADASPRSPANSDRGGG